ncbi:MFS transporter, partial [Streptomyces sp. NPDC002920]
MRNDDEVLLHRLAVVALVLAALNLRPGVTSLGPVLEEVRDSLAMSGTLAGLLTSVPAVCFALVGATAPALARRYGAAGTVAAAGAVLTAGLALRPLAADPTLFVVLTALSLAGIAVVNVLLPAVVKQFFPDRVGAMTGLYSMALNAGASSAAALTVPLTEAFGGDWRYGLGAWAALAALAVPAWSTLARHHPPHPPAPEPTRQSPHQAPCPSPRRGEGQDPRRGEGQDPRRGEGQDPRRGEGQDPRRGEGQDPRRGEGQDPRRGEGQDPRPGDGLSPRSGDRLSPG